MDGQISYPDGFKYLHWLIAVIVIGMLSVSYFLEDLPERYVGFAFMLHKSFGITVLFLMVIRVVWIWRNGKPPLPDSMPIWEKILSNSVHYALYFFVILMPLCGWIMSVAANKPPYFFNLFHLTLPGIEPNKELAHLMKETHNTIAWIIIALLSLHIAGALKHFFIDKDNVLQRMLPRTKRKV
ncbi:cytochrome b [Legionella micdadei]|uniref:Cytochrome b-561 transmembrane protein n=1 Tax=Legionella micdadei TaxID=451 RepID=A0A098GE70_LEGMI|nr:cytochrome b [Legionella micdadei]ARG97656.1 cytochrome b [Legionella micdadei]ARH00029.1 cytochrome b [Legionella micdadei]KTD27745.1 cytochrome b-561 transmembrane protein [Legionella micdadei]NSL17730.1 cytochrome b [Legionella micdadei]CEG60768.1 Cytochrome b-561 transmembrane protein [Legionella micdadei]